jgi:coenzyme PQQ precursor peptide PqqA
LYPRREARMKWIKPEFEIIDLCTEVTLYLYNR